MNSLHVEGLLQQTEPLEEEWRTYWFQALKETCELAVNGPSMEQREHWPDATWPEV